jgi:hypothetical protein
MEPQCCIYPPLSSASDHVGSSRSLRGEERKVCLVLSLCCVLLGAWVGGMGGISIRIKSSATFPDQQVKPDIDLNKSQQKRQQLSVSVRKEKKKQIFATRRCRNNSDEVTRVLNTGVLNTGAQIKYATNFAGGGSSQDDIVADEMTETAFQASLHTKIEDLTTMLHSQNIQIVRRALQQIGCTVEVAENTNHGTRPPPPPSKTMVVLSPTA